MKPTVYVETSIISYLAALPSRDLVVAAHQQVTHDWWSRATSEFDLYASQLVVEEAGKGDPSAAARRAAMMANTALLSLSEEAEALATRLIEEGAIVPQAPEDALHVAVAAVNGMDYLVTWNCKHIANARSRPAIQATVEGAGYRLPVICTPEEMLEAPDVD